ncbi:MAG: ABC transporter ATP-binding protein/permease [Pseudomonadales bacterium]|nr:ABC transporter ATP-binding protein/permease [Pseudomonadales bacterium]
MNKHQPAIANSSPQEHKPSPQPARDYSVFEAELSGQVFSLQLLRRLMQWMKPYRMTLFISAILILVSSSLQVLLPVILSLVVIDHIVMGMTDHLAPDMGMIAAVEQLSELFSLPPLIAACLVYAVVHLLWTITGHLHRMTLIHSVIKGLRDLRLDLFKHLETRPSSFYDRVAVGRVMTRVTNDIEALFELLRGVGTLLGEFVPFFVALGLLLVVSVKLTLLLLLVIPVMAGITALFRRMTRQLFRAVRLSLSALNQNLQENLAGLQVVQLSQRQGYNLTKYTGINKKNRNLEKETATIETIYGAFTDSVSGIALALVIYYGGGAVVQEQISLGGLVLFTRFIDMLFHPIVVLGEQTNILFRAMASGERIFQALDWDERVREPESPASLPDRLKGELVFNNLSFAYDSIMPVLHNLSFTIPAGETLAIVGPTGSGKSTITRLLGRFYDIEDNKIFLDGVDLNKIHTRDLRKRIGIVLQDFHIFSGSIYNNIALGDPHITREIAIKAAKTVNAHAFISQLSDNYDTQLSERGQNLSQGQRQLLAFARVLAADPEILILDEATANIDTETELLIQDALNKLTKNRTSILIAHRLQTIQNADRILVLNNGRVEELGNHTELMLKKSMYYRLHSLQFETESDE